ncbi:glycosyltransferase family 4 protein [Janibacter sp. G368]|uniref:glycosyltransferase family 4 protein n=1 Tax=Janibacter sp. G368 TaxID=3420441 RepID=UPI003D054AD1
MDLILAIGSNAYADYDSLNVPASKLAQFAYFTDPIAPIELHTPKELAYGGTHRFVYVGRLESLKGADLALRALANVNSNAWTLDIIGDGRQRAQLEQDAKSLNIDQQVHFHGTLAHRTIRRMLSMWDTLLVPSRYDGWGNVVNEACMSGVRSIVSDAAGAHDIVASDPLLGEYFPSEDLRALTALLDLEIERPTLSTTERKLISTRAEQKIGSTAGAQYVASLVEYLYCEGHETPRPPWESH